MMFRMLPLPSPPCKQNKRFRSAASGAGVAANLAQQTVETGVESRRAYIHWRSRDGPITGNGFHEVIAQEAPRSTCRSNTEILDPGPTTGAAPHHGAIDPGI